MFTKYVLPILAVAGVSFAAYSVVLARAPQPLSDPLIPPTKRPEAKFKLIAGAGLIEARLENVPVSVNIPGVVTKIHVKKGDVVTQGAPLFEIDDRDYRAQLAMRAADLAAAQAQLHRLEVAPQNGDIPTAEAAVAEAKARLKDAEAKYHRSEKLYNRQMLAPGDYDADHYAHLAAEAALAKAEADRNRIKLTWEADKAVSRAAVAQAESQVNTIKTNIERLTVRALADGEVLQLNVRLGQFAALAWREPMIVLGDVKQLHVRVDIDESDMPYFQPRAAAVATLKGRPGVRFPLKFVYVEPYVVPKQSLTGSNSERVDTRVLQVIYALPNNEDRAVPLFVGEQMDVYMKAAAPPEGLNLESDGRRFKFPDEDQAVAPPDLQTAR